MARSSVFAKTAPNFFRARALELLPRHGQSRFAPVNARLPLASPIGRAAVPAALETGCRAGICNTVTATTISCRKAIVRSAPWSTAIHRFRGCYQVRPATRSAATVELYNIRRIMQIFRHSGLGISRNPPCSIDTTVRGANHVPNRPESGLPSTAPTGIALLKRRVRMDVPRPRRQLNIGI